MPSTSLPFLKFSSPIPQEKIVQCLEVADLFLLSLCSKRCQDIIKTAQIPVEKVHYNLRQTETSTSDLYITVQLPNGTLEIKKASDSEIEILPLGSADQECKMFWKERSPDYSVLYVTGLSPLDSIRKTCKHIFNTFKIPVCSMDVYSMASTILLPILFEFQPTSHYERIYLHYDNNNSLNFQDFQRILNLNVPINRLDFNHENFPDASECKIKEPLKPRKLILSNANWLTVQNISDMECEVLYADGVHIGKEINNFIVNWMAGGFENLKSITLKPMVNLEGLNLNPQNNRPDGKVAVVTLENDTLRITIEQ